MSKKKKADEPVQETTDTVNQAQEDQIKEQPKQEEPQQSSSEADQWKDKYLRLLAEFDNYKKRTAREREQLYEDSAMDTISKILPALDSLQRAAAIEVSSEEAKGVLDGVLALKRQLEEILNQIGVNAIEALGKEFDPQLHNAVMHIEDESFGTNVIVEEFSTGYLYKDKVIRHSMVKVAN